MFYRSLVPSSRTLSSSAGNYEIWNYWKSCDRTEVEGDVDRHSLDIIWKYAVEKSFLVIINIKEEIGNYAARIIKT